MDMIYDTDREVNEAFIKAMKTGREEEEQPAIKTYDIEDTMDRITFRKALTDEIKTKKGTVLSDPMDPAEVYNENATVGAPYSDNMFRAMQLRGGVPQDLLDLISTMDAEEVEGVPITADGRNARQVMRDILKMDPLSLANTVGGGGVPDKEATPELAENIDAITDPSTVLDANVAKDHIVDLAGLRNDPSSSFNAIANVLAGQQKADEDRAMKQIGRKVDRTIAAENSAKRKADIEAAIARKNRDRFGSEIDQVDENDYVDESDYSDVIGMRGQA